MQLDPLLVLKRLATGYDIKCMRVAAPFAGLEDFDYGLRKALDSQFDWEAFGKLLIENTASTCFISPSYLSSLFKQDTGTTIVDYINSQRVDRAAVLLATTDRSIAAVAAAVGILDVNYFTKIFKKQLGTTPTQYRREKKAMLGH
ncbi:helix-turn-helix transcriptional regulator [Gemmiger sp.]|uniref:helix-turn-helix transcriptional regulator n=1 Tax=Gemmiger sp. TaxID=2049027 RepID=UPI002F95B70E